MKKNPIQFQKGFSLAAKLSSGQMRRDGFFGDQAASVLHTTVSRLACRTRKHHKWTDVR